MENVTLVSPRVSSHHFAVTLVCLPDTTKAKDGFTPRSIDMLCCSVLVSITTTFLLDGASKYSSGAPSAIARFVKTSEGLKAPIDENVCRSITKILPPVPLRVRSGDRRM